MLELLSYDFMQRSLVAAALVGALCSVIGVFVVLRGLAFVGAGTAHAAFAGWPGLSGRRAAIAAGDCVRIGHCLGHRPYGRTGADEAGCVDRYSVHRHHGAGHSLYRTHENIQCGSVWLSVRERVVGHDRRVAHHCRTQFPSARDVLAFSKEFYFVAFDQEMAEASGVPARRIYYLLLTLVALTMVVSLKTVGAILVFAMVLIPASTAYQLTHSLRHMTFYAVAIGTASSVGGVLLSYVWDVPTGPAIVLLATGIFFVSVLLSPKRWKSPYVIKKDR